MDRNQIQEAVVAELLRIAPELEPGELVAAKPLRDQVDLDSMDWLNFLVALHEKLAVEIPESDYGRLGTLDQIVDYLDRSSGESDYGRLGTLDQIVDYLDRSSGESERAPRS